MPKRSSRVTSSSWRPQRSVLSMCSLQQFRKCLDFMIPLNESHIRIILKPWVAHFNEGRPHSSLGPGIPEPSFPKVPLQTRRHHIPDNHRVSAIPVLGGLHHEYKLEKITA